MMVAQAGEIGDEVVMQVCGPGCAAAIDKVLRTKIQATQRPAKNPSPRRPSKTA
jgi:hypothetical protein